MQTQDYAILVLAALILAGIFAISPNALAPANGTPSAGYSIDLSGINRNAPFLPEEDFPPH